MLSKLYSKYNASLLKTINFRRVSLTIAESIDAWRIVPRAMLLGYGYLIIQMYLWYKSIPVYPLTKCDIGVLQILVNGGMAVDAAKTYACSVTEVVGGPTAAQTTLVTTIIGLSAAVFGLYTNSGRKWDSGLPHDVDANPNLTKAEMESLESK